MSSITFVPLALRAITRRIVLLLAFAAAFLAAAASARLLTGAGSDHAELGRIFELGGPTLASVFLLAGWLIGRFPLIATLVLTAGLFSQDRADGIARLYCARPVSWLAFYAQRFAALAVLAFVLSALLLPLFDVILIGRWPGPAVLVLIAANVIVYGALVALLSVWTRADAWIALLLGTLAMTWHALRSAGLLDALSAGGREFVTIVLPPHGALAALENAFGQLRPMPWEAFAFASAYGVALLLLAALSLSRREL